MYFVGIDISKYKHDCFICTETGEVIEEAKRLQIPYVMVDSKKKLGKACNIKVDASTVAIRRE